MPRSVTIQGMDATAAQAVPASLANVLEPDERLLWWGRPEPRLYIAGGFGVTAPLGLIGLLSVVSWVGGAPLGGLPPWALTVVGLVLTFSLHMLLLRPLLGLHQARCTTYAITDRRALVVCGRTRRLLQQIRHDEGELLVIEGLRSRARIQFGRTAASSLEVLIFGRAAIPGFYGLTEIKPVIDLLHQYRRPPAAVE